MEKGKIIAASSKEIFDLLKNQIDPMDFSLIDWSFSGNEVIRKTTVLFPNAIIADYNLSDMTGLDFAKTIEDLHICPVLILASHQQSEYINDLKTSSLDIFCISKPIDKTVLNHTLSLAIKLTKRIHEYEYQIDNLKKQLEDRKLIEKAKGILMKKFNMTEDAAYKEMRSKAMNSAKPLAEIAKTIIDMFKIFDI
ncbi:MAG: ANTAR domain-containing protein [Elusimicrobiota bacterium]|jgi:response regulator NasT|nr:ANTAR domain-containing protein [Elusimicrobiota bacterium]